jgi:O-antigen/teichoic acid export membrane protein
LGYPTFTNHLPRSELVEGFYFSITLASQSIYNDVDKIMLVRLSTLEAAGIYGSAYRLIDVAFQPVGSLIYSAYARFFQHGQGGLAASTGFAKRLLPFAVGYALLATVGLYSTAPIVPLVLGTKFSAGVGALRWLSPLLIFKAIHYFLADSLTGAGFQGARCAVQAAIAGVNVVLNLWLIPAYSWRGAAWSSLACDGLLVLALLLTIAILLGTNVVRRRRDVPADISA